MSNFDLRQIFDLDNLNNISEYIPATLYSQDFYDDVIYKHEIFENIDIVYNGILMYDESLKDMYKNSENDIKLLIKAILRGLWVDETYVNHIQSQPQRGTTWSTARTGIVEKNKDGFINTIIPPRLTGSIIGPCIGHEKKFSSWKDLEISDVDIKLQRPEFTITNNQLLNMLWPDLRKQSQQQQQQQSSNSENGYTEAWIKNEYRQMGIYKQYAGYTPKYFLTRDMLTFALSKGTAYEPLVMAMFYNIMGCIVHGGYSGCSSQLSIEPNQHDASSAFYENNKQKKHCIGNACDGYNPECFYAHTNQYSNYWINQTGLRIDIKTPWIAASPDGLLYTCDFPYIKDTLHCTGLEIKVRTHENGLPFGEIPHNYYDQIQSAMATFKDEYNLKSYKFISYTPNKMHVFSFAYDSDYWEKFCLLRLKHFYFRRLLPLFILKLFGRLKNNSLDTLSSCHKDTYLKFFPLCNTKRKERASESTSTEFIEIDNIK